MENIKYTFDESHINVIIRMLIDNQDFLRKYRDLIDFNYFGNEVKGTIVKEIFNYFDKYKKSPSYEIVIHESIANKIARIPESLILETIEEIVKTNVADKEYICDKIVEFAKHQAIKNAILKSASLIKTGDYEKIQKMIEDAVGVGRNLEGIGIDYFDSIEERADLRAVLESPANKILTLIPDLDDRLGGGIARKHLAVILAPPGYGKTTFLASIVRACLPQNKKAVFYSLEMTDTEIADKIDSGLTGIPLKDMIGRKKETIEKLQSIKKIYGGNLIVKEYTAKGCSVQIIENHLMTLSDQGFKADLIAIDYAEIMKPPVYRQNKWDEIGEIYNGLKAMAKERDIVVWTASQTNKAGADKETIGLSDTGMSWEKVKIADVIVSINQTETEKKSNDLRIYINKNRKGIQDIYIKLTKQFECMRFVGRKQ